jgi:Ala-tRNA(Pro) deacylase
VLALLNEHRARFRVIEHSPEGGTEAVSALRGHPAGEAAKCLVLRVKLDRKATRYVLAVVRGDSRLDMDAVRALLGARYVAFAEAETAERLAGSVAGTVLPFALHPDLELIVDPGVLTMPMLHFNAGRLDRSLALASEDYRRIAQPRVARIAAMADGA